MKIDKTAFIVCFKVACTTLAFVFMSSSCKKSPVENPFTETTTLDCRNLLIRNITLKDSIIELSLENTCKNCEDDWVYLSMTMMSRKNQQDTIAAVCGGCNNLSAPKNDEIVRYSFDKKFGILPDLTAVQFNYGYLCTDLSYLPK